MSVKRTAHTPLARILEEQGRKLRWLARQTGYSERHINRVASGKHVGSREFHLRVQAALGAQYPIPKEAA